MSQYFKKQTLHLIRLSLFLFSVCFQTNLSAAEPPPPKQVWSKELFLKLSCSPRGGMFFSMMSLLGALEMYERGQIQGVEVDYGCDGIYGPYYDPTMGPNWWSYYYEPLSVGNKTANNVVVTCNGFGKRYLSLRAINKMSRTQAHHYLKKYVKVKPYIELIVEDCVREKFKEKTLVGVHYRGTDKRKEAPRTSYNKVIDAVRRNIAEIAGDDCLIFVATDEQGFLQAISQAFPNKVVYRESVDRAKDFSSPIHLDCSSPHKSGEDALVDCLLLSRCDMIVRTESYLSHVATFFNPEAPVVLVK